MKHDAAKGSTACRVLVFPDENDRETIQLAVFNLMRSRCQRTREDMRRVIAEIMRRNNIKTWAFEKHIFVLDGENSVGVYSRTGRKRKKRTRLR